MVFFLPCGKLHIFLKLSFVIFCIKLYKSSCDILFNSLYFFYLLHALYLNQNKSKLGTSLLAIAVGINQKELVNKIVNKVVFFMLFYSCLSKDQILTYLYKMLKLSYLMTWIICSFLQMILSWCFFIMTELWISGMIWTGVTESFMSLPKTKPSGMFLRDFPQTSYLLLSSCI